MREIRTKQHRRYYVKRVFDDYAIGDEFFRTGSPNDDAIVEYYCEIVYNEKEACPECGKEYKNLNRHKCKGGN